MHLICQGIIKTGVGVDQDAHRLRQDWRLDVQGLVDLRAAAKQRLQPTQTPNGYSLQRTLYMA